MVNIFNIFKRKPKDPELSWQELQEAIASHKKIAWVIETAECESSYLFSKFYGKPALTVDESWPQCSQCDSSMHFLMQINSKQLPEHSKASFEDGILQVFHCDQCTVDSNAENPFEDTTLVRWLDTSSQDLTTAETPKSVKQYTEMQITGWTAQDDFPTPTQCKNLGCELTLEQEELLSEKGYPLHCDKIMGWSNSRKVDNSTNPMLTAMVHLVSKGNAQREFPNNRNMNIVQSAKNTGQLLAV